MPAPYVDAWCAVISDIEFVQFHPTALYVESAPRFLLSEALRGEVAVLAVKGAEQILKREVDQAVHADLLNQLKAEL